MTHKPKVFIYIALALSLVVLSFPVQALLLYSHSVGEITAVLNKISFLNFLSMVSLGVTSYLIYNASPVLKIFVPISAVLVIWNNLVVGSYATDFSMITTTFASLGFLALFTPLATIEARYILEDSRRRWWMRPKRYQKRVSATLNPFVGATIHAHTYDISETGAFIHLDNEGGCDIPNVGESLRISINVGGMRNVRCEALIVRVTEPKGSYPTGLGIHFKGIDKDTRKDLARFLKKNPDAHLDFN